MAPATRQARKMVADNNGGNATPTRRWHRLILDDDSEEDNEGSKPCMETSKRKEPSQKPDRDTACAMEAEPVHSCADERGLVTTGLPPPKEPPRRSSNPIQMPNLLSETSSLPPKPIPEKRPRNPELRALLESIWPERRPTYSKEVSLGNNEGESIPCRLHRRASQSQADGLDEAEDSGVEVPDKNVHVRHKDQKSSDYILPQRPQSCEPSCEASKPTCSHLEEENEESASSNDHTSLDQELLESQQLSVSSSLSSPPDSPTETKAEPAIAHEVVQSMTRPVSAAESSAWNHAMSLDSQAKKFAQESSTSRDRLRTKNHDHGAEELPRKRGPATTPLLDDSSIANKVLKPTSIPSRKNDKVKSTRGADSLVADHATVTETAQLGEELESSTAETQSASEEPKTLLEDIVEAVPRSNRKAFTTGDVAIILDTGDLTKTQRECVGYAEAGVCITDSLLETANLTNCGCETYQRALDTATAVKEEPNQEGHDDTAAQSPPRVNWLKAFEAFLCIVTNTKVPRPRDLQAILRIIGSNAKAALPQIEGVLKFAKHFEAVEAVATTLTLVIHAYTGNNTLWPAVADEAASWLVVAQEIEDEAVFKEAFCHVVGRWPEWPWQKSIASISDGLKADIEVARNEIEIKHQATQVKLLRLTLTTDKNTGIPVSQRNAPYKYDVVCFWSQWIASHFEYLEAKREVDGLGDPPKSDFCDHSDNTCLNIAKLYRAMAKGGDAYLPFDLMMKKWDKKTYGSDETEQRDALAELNRAASVIVAPMVESSLQYGMKHELDYLTCIKVEAKDIPWKMHEEHQDAEMEI